MIGIIRNILEFIGISFVAVPVIHYCLDFWISDWSAIHGHHCSHCPWKVTK